MAGSFTVGVCVRLPDRLTRRRDGLICKSGSLFSASSRAGKDKQTGEAISTSGVYMSVGLACDRTIFSGFVTVMVGRCVVSGEGEELK